jgi:hypothetical protein
MSKHDALSDTVESRNLGRRHARLLAMASKRGGGETLIDQETGTPG